MKGPMLQNLKEIYFYFTYDVIEPLQLMHTIITLLIGCNGYLQNVDVRSIYQEKNETLNVNITEVLRQQILEFRSRFNASW